MYKRIIITTLLFSLLFSVGFAQSSFELRYYTPDVRANGETDFTGETAILTTEQRVDFLKKYASIASHFFHDSLYNTVVVPDNEIQETIAGLKPLPQPEIRKKLILSDWKYMGYKPDSHSENQKQLAQWNERKGIEISDGQLLVKENNEPIILSFAPQVWRFSISWIACLEVNNKRVAFELSDKQLNIASTVGFEKNGKFFYTTEGIQVDTLLYEKNKWYSFRVEVDLCAQYNQVGHYNLYIDDKLIADYVPIERAIKGRSTFSSMAEVNAFAVSAEQPIKLDNIYGLGYALTGRTNYPYISHTFLDENFDERPNISGWTELSYNDSGWQEEELPIAHGSERYSQEDLYLRKKVFIPKTAQAFLNIETLDPGGEVWINGKKIITIENRYPNYLDVSSYLIPDQINLIAIKVNHFYLYKETGEFMPHTSLDLNVGWFAGRISLDLVPEVFLKEVFSHTLSLSENKAILKNKIEIKSEKPFKGRVQIEVFPWYPNESKKAVVKKSIEIDIQDSSDWMEEIVLNNPLLWTPENPALYKIHVTLYNEQKKAIDDFVTTTGIRTVDQKGGAFRLNNQISMLNGAQIMGFRSPLEKSVIWNRCPPVEWLVKELLMIKKMNGNLLRIHVHGWEGSDSEGINDPRIAELADQLGVMLIWTTPSWIRTGFDWRQIDFKGYPLYMRQVYNHPSIVMWEASNHPNSFKSKGVEDSDEFCETVYNTIYPVDSSRIISFTSYLKHTHYGNDEGTIDYRNNPIQASWAYTAPMVTRGNQDAPTGYSNVWTTLRKWDSNPYIISVLNSPDRAYFNFEHQESMAQPNWELFRGKPYYRMHSYEWSYDERTIGRRLSLDEWRESQAYQAFSAWEAIKKMRIIGYDGFSWCTIHGGANSGTYHKPIIDMHGHAKLAYWTNKMAFQHTVAGSNNVDVIYGPDDTLTPVIIHWGKKEKTSLSVEVKTVEGVLIDKKDYMEIELPEGREAISLPGFRPDWKEEGFYIIEYNFK